MKKLAFFCLIFLLALATARAAESRETLTLSTADIKALAIDCGAGYLKIQGKEGLARIEVSARLHVRGVRDSEFPEFRKEHIILKLEKVGSQAVLTAGINEKFSLEKLFAGGWDAWIDLDVSLPPGLALEIEDGSGNIDVRTMGNGLELDDGSGDVTIAGIAGKVEIEDGSGDFFLADLQGDLEIEDGSGDIDLKDAGGSVDIDDGSGSIAIRGAKGPVIIEDGSGDIDIDGVENDVNIEEAGSGGLSIRNVKGKVRK